jgi:hypothetical protein
MDEEISFSRVPGKAPRVISRDSLFDDLLGESEELSESAKADFSQVKGILIFGGSSLEVTIEHPRAPVDPNSVNVRDKPIFDVLALDLATVFPALSGKGLPIGSFSGRQICLCKAPAGSDERNNWYSRALQEYFQTEPGGSLLSFPEVRRNYKRWWVLKPDSDVGPLKTLNVSQTLTQELPWKSEFPATTRAIDHDSSEAAFQKRFDQFGEAVVRELAQIQSISDISATVIIWIYVGPSEHQAKQIKNVAPSWGVSLFAVIRPIEFNASTTNHWMNNPQLQDCLLLAVNKLYLYLTSAAYKTLEYRRLLDEAQMTASQAVAHEFKNLTQDISSLGSSLHDEFFDAIQKMRRQAKDEQILTDLLTTPLSRLSKLSTISRLTSAVALATYWLTTPDARYSIILERDPACQIFDAAVHLVLAMCKETRQDWEIEGPTLDQVCQTLQSVYGSADPNELVERLDVALLLFAISEPVRNLRSKDSSHPKVFIHTEVRGQSLYICQKTFESIRPDDTETSRAASRVNRLLSAGSNLAGGNLSEKFIALDETVRVVNLEKHSDKNFVVHRETRIDVFGIPVER